MAASLAVPAGSLPARSSPQQAPQAGQMTGTHPLMGMHLARDGQPAKAPGALTEELAVAGAAGKGAAEAEALVGAAETAGVKGGAVPPQETAGMGVMLRQAGTAGAPRAGAALVRPEVRPLTDFLAMPCAAHSCPCQNNPQGLLPESSLYDKSLRLGSVYRVLAGRLCKGWEGAQ